VASKPRDPAPAAAPSPAPAPPATPAHPTVATATPAAPAARPAVTFNGLKFLGTEDGKPRDRDVSLRMEPDGLHVMNGSLVIESVGYHEVIALFHSHSKEPRWVTPDGSAVPVMKVGGKFSFFKGTPDWVTVRTSKGFIPLRVDDQDLARFIAELESRTGTKIVRAK
jgi:hypothetical protein